jgi:hypothetical protein
MYKPDFAGRGELCGKYVSTFIVSLEGLVSFSMKKGGSEVSMEEDKFGICELFKFEVESEEDIG